MAEGLDLRYEHGRSLGVLGRMHRDTTLGMGGQDLLHEYYYDYDLC